MDLTRNRWVKIIHFSLCYSLSQISRLKREGDREYATTGSFAYFKPPTLLSIHHQAMRQAANREKAAKIAEKDPFGSVDEQLDRSAASEEVNTAAMAQVWRV